MSEPARRSGLQYADEDAVIADVQRLRRGYAKGGTWSLAQMCCHLDRAVKARMQPGPHGPNTPEQDARRELIRDVLASGKLPNGIQAPGAMQPPADCGGDAVDSFIATMKTFKAFKDPIAPHRLFGHLPDADHRKLNLIHCAHHLSYLTPTG